MPFGAILAGDVFQCKLNECFGKIEQVIVTVDDIMIVVYNPDHSEHNHAFTTLLQTAEKCNVKLTYDRFNASNMKLNSLVKLILYVDASQAKINWQLLHL